MKQATNPQVLPMCTLLCDEKRRQFFAHGQDYDLLPQGLFPAGRLTERGYNSFTEETNSKQTISKSPGMLSLLAKGYKHHKAHEHYQAASVLHTIPNSAWVGVTSPEHKAEWRKAQDLFSQGSKNLSTCWKQNTELHQKLKNLLTFCFKTYTATRESPFSCRQQERSGWQWTPRDGFIRSNNKVNGYWREQQETNSDRFNIIKWELRR